MNRITIWLDEEVLGRLVLNNVPVVGDFLAYKNKNLKITERWFDLNGREEKETNPDVDLMCIETN